MTFLDCNSSSSQKNVAYLEGQCKEMKIATQVIFERGCFAPVCFFKLSVRTLFKRAMSAEVELKIASCGAWGISGILPLTD